MDTVLVALGGLLLKALPTFLIVLVLHFYLKYVFFKPLERVLDERYRATEGARRQAREALDRAEAKAAEYGGTLRTARAEIYQQQEENHRRLEEQYKHELGEARRRSEEAVRQAKAELAGEAAQARQRLAQEAEALATQIAGSVLRGRAA